MKAAEAVARVDAASDELLAVHDAIKHGSGVQATFPWEHDWNADPVTDLLAEAHRSASEAARLLAKAASPAAEEPQRFSCPYDGEPCRENCPALTDCRHTAAEEPQP